LHHPKSASPHSSCKSYHPVKKYSHLLRISGRFDTAMFGRSVPVHLTEFLDGRGRPASGPLDGAGRRSIYLAVRRNFLSPMMTAFDTPAPVSAVGRRNSSNVPAQALIMLNDPFVADQAAVWAKQSLKTPLPPRDRIDQLYRQAFARGATSEETAAALDFLQTQATALQIPKSSIDRDPRPWADLCHVLFNVKEFTFVN
jgi:hypothetical protein